MKEMITGIVGGIPELMKNTHLTVSLAGTPAAVAVGLVCGSGVIIYGIYNWEKLQELKLMRQAADPATESKEKKQAIILKLSKDECA
jgi:cytochrome c-type biogenesis protein CcmH/NrfG